MVVRFDANPRWRRRLPSHFCGVFDHSLPHTVTQSGTSWFSSRDGRGLVSARALICGHGETIIICAIIYIFRALTPSLPSRLAPAPYPGNNDMITTPFSRKPSQFHHDFELVSVESIQAGMMTELRYLFI